MTYIQIPRKLLFIAPGISLLLHLIEYLTTSLLVNYDQAAIADVFIRLIHRVRSFTHLYFRK